MTKRNSGDIVYLSAGFSARTLKFLYLIVSVGYRSRFVIPPPREDPGVSSHVKMTNDKKKLRPGETKQGYKS